MDQGLLVTSGYHLLERLDRDGMGATAAIWYYDVEQDAWRLWIVPRGAGTNKRDFYRRVSECLYQPPAIDLAVSDIQMMKADHPAIVGLAALHHVRSTSGASVSDSLVNGVFLSKAIVLRLDLDARADAA